MVSAIIVAAGKGVRMKGRVRKQYLDLSGRSVLSHSLTTLDSCNLIGEIFIVVPKEDIEYCQKKILSALDLNKLVGLVEGGTHRYDSVYNGLRSVDKKTDVVVIHDGVRPFVQGEDLTACILIAKDYGACIFGIPTSDTLKHVRQSGIIEGTLSRKNVWFAQTPQAFHYDLIRKAHETARRDGYGATDDASLVEKLGIDVKIIHGSRYNLKITTQEDLALAQAMLDAGLV